MTGKRTGRKKKEEKKKLVVIPSREEYGSDADNLSSEEDEQEIQDDQKLKPKEDEVKINITPLPQREPKNKTKRTKEIKADTQITDSIPSKKQKTENEEIISKTVSNSDQSAITTNETPLNKGTRILKIRGSKQLLNPTSSNESSVKKIPLNSTSTIQESVITKDRIQKRLEKFGKKPENSNSSSTNSTLTLTLNSSSTATKSTNSTTSVISKEKLEARAAKFGKV